MVITFGFDFRRPSVARNAAAGAARVNDFESVASATLFSFKTTLIGCRWVTPMAIRWPAKCSHAAVGSTQDCNYVNYELRLLPTGDIVSTCHSACRCILLGPGQQIEITVTEKGSVSTASAPFSPQPHQRSRHDCRRTRMQIVCNSLRASKVSSLTF